MAGPLQILLRLFTLFLIPLSPFVAFLYYKVQGDSMKSSGRLTSRKILLLLLTIVFLLPLPVLHVVFQEGNQSVDRVPGSYIQGLNYFGAVTSKGTVGQTVPLTLRDVPPFGLYQNEQNYNILNYEASWADSPSIRASVVGDSPLYIVLTSTDSRTWSYIGNYSSYAAEQDQLSTFPWFDKSYSDSSVEIYVATFQ